MRRRVHVVTVWLAAKKRETKRLNRCCRDAPTSLCRAGKFVRVTRELEAMPEQYSQPGKAGTWEANQGHDASSTPSEWHGPSPRSARAPLFPHCSAAARDDFINILPADQ